MVWEVTPISNTVITEFVPDVLYISRQEKDLVAMSAGSGFVESVWIIIRIMVNCAVGALRVLCDKI